MLLPNVWGGGMLFAFSGMDGQTNWKYPLVGSALEHRRGFFFHSQGTPTLTISALNEERCEAQETGIADEIASSDLVVFCVDYAAASFRIECVFVSANVVAVRATATRVDKPCTVLVASNIEGDEAEAVGGSLRQRVGSCLYELSCEAGHADAEEGRACATLRKTGESAIWVWRYWPEGQGSEPVSIDSTSLDEIIGERLRFFEQLPKPTSAGAKAVRTFAKCASVLKVNCCSPEGKFPFEWTTPDRWPHQNMWIWDSAFHAIGLRHFSVRWAVDAIKSVLAVQRENGFVPHMMTPDGSGDSDIIQPPILAWGSWKVYQKGRSNDFLEWVYPRIAAMVRYDLTARDTDGNGLAEWESGGASGMDNSPRFDYPHRDAVDLNSYLANDMRYLAKIAREIGLEAEAKDWEIDADELARRINALLWDAETGFYYDADVNGELIKIKTQAGFTPLFAGVCDERQADALVRVLTKTSEFWRPLPVASVAASEPSYSNNMWRGPVWINYNYFIIEGLRRYGYRAEAEELKRITLNEITDWYGRDGVIYEFYDAERKTRPVFLRRKKLGGPKPAGADVMLGTNIRDYNFTAALFLDLMMER